MTKRRSVIDRLTSIWADQPGTVREVAARYVPEANEYEITEVERGIESYDYSGSSSMLARRRPSLGKGVVPGGQQRIIRKFDPFCG